MNLEYEIRHAGVKGMRWGVRKDTDKSFNMKRRRIQSTDDLTETKIVTRGKTTSITSRNGKQKAKLVVKRDKGAKLVAKMDDAKVKVVVSNAANIAAGSLRVAAAFIPGASVLNGVATAASLVGTIATLKK